ncbi:MAG: type IV pilin protein [Gemmatimonadales bacterium]
MKQRGFTLIELLVVVTILGILATIAIPRLGATRERAVLASMVSDLRNLVVAQTSFFSSYQDYAPQMAGAEVPGPGTRGRVAMSPSPGNTIAIRRRAPTNTNGAGFSATVTNPMATRLGARTCGVYVGARNYAPNKAVTTEGVPACY